MGYIRFTTERRVAAGRSLIFRVISKKRLAGSDAAVDISDEIDNLSAIDHPHVVRLLDHFESRDK